MGRQYSLREVQEMFEIVEQIKKNTSVIKAVYSGDPRLVGCVDDCKRKLRDLIPKYEEKVPESIQKILGIDPKNLEALL